MSQGLLEYVKYRKEYSDEQLIESSLMSKEDIETNKKAVRDINIQKIRLLMSLILIIGVPLSIIICSSEAFKSRDAMIGCLVPLSIWSGQCIISIHEYSKLKKLKKLEVTREFLIDISRDTLEGEQTLDIDILS